MLFNVVPAMELIHIRQQLAISCLKPGVTFSWNSTPRHRHLNPETRQIVPNSLNLSQVVLNMGSRSDD